MHILILDTKNQVIENVKRYKGTINSSVFALQKSFVQRLCAIVPMSSYNHPSGDPTPSPENRPQLTHYLIGISPEAGFFINPALLALDAPDTAA